MSPHSWLQNLRSGLAPRRSQRDHGRRGSLRAATHRLNLEGLEDRRVLAFLAPVDYPIGAEPYAVVAAFSRAEGDFDRDGNLDRAVVNGDTLTVLLGNGDGTFEATSSSIGFGEGESPIAIAAGDFNGDGLIDLGLTSSSPYDYYGDYGNANVLLGNGDGSFSGPNITPLGYGSFSSAVAADINGDAFDDFVTLNASAVNVLFGSSSGVLQGLFSFPTEYLAIAVDDGDLDADGDTDLVVVSSYPGYHVNVLLGNGVGSFSASTQYAMSHYGSSVVLGDFTGDGNLDVATAHSNWDVLSVFPGWGDGTLGPRMDFTVEPYVRAVAAGDFDGDGWLDLATSGYDGSNMFSVLINDQIWPDTSPSLSISNTSVTEGDGDAVSMVFTVTRTGGDLADTSTVHYSTANGGALAGSDYVAASGTVTFGPGEATQTITVLVNGDLTDEWDQGFYVNLSAATGAVIADGQALGTIVDNDPPPTITISPIVSAKEGHEGTKSLNFIVTLSVASEKEVRVNFATADGTATTADSDYVPRSGTLIFAPGTTSKTISVQVRGDKKREANERFFVNLSSATNGTIAAAQGIGEILNDDQR